MKGNRAKINQSEILSGWKEVANYLGKGVRTVQRYERLFGLPVRRPANKPWGSVVATKGELDAWVAASPIREGLQLLQPETASSSETWTDIRESAARMKVLAQQMADLRAELKGSVELLRASIREVSGELNAQEWTRRVAAQADQTRNLFNLLNGDTGKRKAS